MGVIRDSYLGFLATYTVRFEIFCVFFCWDPPVRFPTGFNGLVEVGIPEQIQMMTFQSLNGGCSNPSQATKRNNKNPVDPEYLCYIYRERGVLPAI